MTQGQNRFYQELEDLSFELAKKYDTIVPDDQRLTELNDLINLVNNLLLKHRANDVKDLVAKRQQFSDSLAKANNFDNEIKKLELLISEKNIQLQKKCSSISAKRKKAIPELERFINSGLTDLSMPQAEFKVNLEKREIYDQFGLDELTVLVRTNKGAEFSPISKVASGGEISRIMFLIKAAVASKKSIKTLVLDEIDTGISGEVASRLAAQIKLMSKNSQIMVGSQ